MAAAAAATCGGSTAVETVVGPNGVRCQTTLAGQPSSLPPIGGNVTVNVSAARDCTWTASTDSSWMQLNATSGQGDATIAVAVAANEVPSPRSGAIAVNDQRFVVSQEPRPCTYELRASTQSFGSDGGRGSIAIETLSGCSWTATSSAAWLRVLTASGSGAGSVAFEAAPNDGAAREASIAVAGLPVTINQAAAGLPNPTGPNCVVTLAPATIPAVPAGGTHTVMLTIPPSCDWTAMSSAPWLTVAPAGGRGAATLTLTVARNTGTARSATVAVGDQMATVNQAAAPACTVTIDPASASFTAAGGDGRVRVTTQDGCEWAATGGASWTPITGARGTGSGDARYTVSANTATTARSTTLTIGGRTHTVSQQAAAPSCTYTLEPGSRAFGAAGGDGTVTVTTQPGCGWSASGAPPWVAVTGGQGTGTGQFSYTVQSNGAATARSGGITVAGQVHTISQEAAAPTCTYSLQPTSRNFGAAGGEGRATVVTQAGCTWSASSGAPWATLAVEAGTGQGDVVYNVQANSAASPRSTTVTVNGQPHTVTQEAAAPTCTFAVQPASLNFGAGGGEGRFDVVTQAGCSWTAASGAGWATVTSGAGSGPAQVVYSVQANGATSARTTTINVNGQLHAVTQEAAAPTCTYSVQPVSQNFPAGGGAGEFNVVTQAGCAWSAASGAGWATVGTATGSGPGTVSYSVQPNTASTMRQTAISVNGQSHTVTQDAAAPPPPPCSYAIDSASRDFTSAGGEGIVRVTTGPSCTWSASSPVPWIAMATSGGTGSGEARYTVAPNTDDDREATLTVAGQSHRVRQEEADDHLFLMNH